jgi:hypothetical protein
MIKTDDILRPTPTSSHGLQVWGIRDDLVVVYNATIGSASPRVLSRYDGWVIERNGEVVGTV